MRAFEYVWSCPGTWVFVAKRDSETARTSRAEQSRRFLQRDGGSRFHISFPCYYTHSINPSLPSWWIRSTGSKACLLLNITVTLLHVLPLLIPARGREEGRGWKPSEGKRHAVHKVSRPLFKKANSHNFHGLPRIHACVIVVTTGASAFDCLLCSLILCLVCAIKHILTVSSLIETFPCSEYYCHWHWWGQSGWKLCCEVR